MMAKPIRALELHYPMIQFLIMSIIIWTAPWAGMKQWIRVLIGYQSEQNDPALSVTVAIDTDMGYWPRPFFSL